MSSAAAAFASAFAPVSVQVQPAVVVAALPNTAVGSGLMQLPLLTRAQPWPAQRNS